MRTARRVGFLLAILLFPLATASSARADGIAGDYLEVRTASVFAGACHYNGELVTTGRDALLAWNIRSGKWRGVDLSGVRVMAAVSSDANLSEAGAAHRSELMVDAAASDAQVAAVTEALKDRFAAALGEIVKVRRAPVSFRRDGKTYKVSASGLASALVEAMPNDMCCKMPHMVWYAPLVAIKERRVGFTVKALYTGGVVTDPWQRSGENSAFYGSFYL